MNKESLIPMCFDADMKVPISIVEISKVFIEKGYKLFIVGGAVRDFLLNEKIKDFDLATDALPDVVEHIMQDAGYKTIATGKSFGVINVFVGDDEYEIATFRSEFYTEDSKRRPKGVEFTDIETDVLRRDLTINALFFDINKRVIVDLVGGVSDLKEGIIRTVGNPIDRFSEDRLRILRAIRFAARFGSKLNSEIDAVLREDANLDGISGERIRDEFIKGIKSAKSVVGFLEMLDNYQLFDWIFKGLYVNKTFIEERDVRVLLAVLLNGNGAILAKELNNLKYSVEEIKSITFLLKLLTLSPETAVTLKRQEKNSYTEIHQIINFTRRMNLDLKLVNSFVNFKLTVNGNEVMTKFNLKEGKELGDKINELETNFFKEIL